MSTVRSYCPKKRCSQRHLTSRLADYISSVSTANISRQFEFLQNAWIANTKFSGVTGESDPLLGNRESLPGCPVTGNFTMPGDGTLRRRVSGLPQFVTVRGGAYFFLPSLRALRYFAGA